MAENVQPIVSVVTPVYNGEKYLPECIESVLAQTYKNFEYLIVNNCSKDATLKIAQTYASKDSRIRIHDNEQFLDIIANHNNAFRQISPLAKYCKIVSADDSINIDCVEKMVDFAEANPTIGIVGSYQQCGDRVRWQGFPYPQSVFQGAEICRQFILRHDPNFGFGAPTSMLYRADLIRRTKEFFPNPSPQSDTSACFEAMQHSDFGFIYQVLSIERLHEETQSSKSSEMNFYSPAYLSDLLQYGGNFLSKEELQMAIDRLLDEYYRFLAVQYFKRKQGDDFWNYHRNRLKELGFPLKRLHLVKALLVLILKELSNPGLAIGKFQKARRRTPTNQPMIKQAKTPKAPRLNGI